MESKTNSYLPDVKHRYLILGGLGFIGQAFTNFLYNDGECAFESLLIVDKKIKMFVRIPKGRESIYSDPRLQLVQMDLSREQDVTNLFEKHGPFAVVVNCAAETRYDMSQDEYQKNTVKVAQVCAAVAKRAGVKKFIHLSNCQVYGSTKSPADEKSKLNPIYIHGKIALDTEDIIRSITGLPLIILRLPIVYGIEDLEGFVSINIVATFVYKQAKKAMKILWDDNKRIHTVHVRDVCRAIAFSTSYHGSENLFNVVDSGDTTQARFYSALANATGLKIEIVGSFKSHLASLMLDSVISKMNDMHVREWFEILQNNQIADSPLNVKIYKEMVENTNLNVSGDLIKSKGFELQHPWVNVQLLDEIIQSYIREGYIA